MIYIINGYPQSGKDSVVSIFEELHPEIRVGNYSSVELPKEIFSIFEEYDKSPEGRAKLSQVKNALEGRVDYVRVEVEDRLRLVDVLFVHCREVRNIKRLQRQFPGSVTVLVKRSKAKEEYLSGRVTNGSDSDVEGMSYDVVINNEGSLEDLKREVKVKLTGEAFPKPSGYFDW